MAGLHHKALAHVVRRAAVHVQGADAFSQSGSPSDLPAGKMNAWEVAMLLTTFIIGIIFYSLVKYTVGELIMALTMVEDESTSVTVIQHQKPYQDDEKAPLIDEEVIIAREQPITSKIRRTIHHLTSIGGRKARWRGLSASIWTSLIIWAMNWNYGYVMTLFPWSQEVRTLVASILVAVLFSRFHMAWTHVVISQPSPLSWWRRMAVGGFSIKALAIPSAAVTLTEFTVLHVSRAIHNSFGPLPDMQDEPMAEEQARNEMHRLFATMAVAIFLYVALVIPATVTLVRVEASLLPEDAETIVSFDRTLAGTAPAPGQTEGVEYLKWYKNAWSTFGKSARLRLLKLYVKLGAILLMIDALFGVVIMAELVFIGLDRVKGSYIWASNNMDKDINWERFSTPKIN